LRGYRIAMQFVFCSGRPSEHSLQNASTVHLAVSQTISGAAVTCRPAHVSPVFPLVPSTNNCRSEHIHRMVLSNVAVTTEQYQGKYIGLILAKGFILYVCYFSFLLSLKISPNFELWPVRKYLKFYVRLSHFGRREIIYIVKNIQYFIM
jgi:hypothetical protein